MEKDTVYNRDNYDHNNHHENIFGQEWLLVAENSQLSTDQRSKLVVLAENLHANWLVAVLKKMGKSVKRLVRHTQHQTCLLMDNIYEKQKIRIREQIRKQRSSNLNSYEEGPEPEGSKLYTLILKPMHRFLVFLGKIYPRYFDLDHRMPEYSWRPVRKQLRAVVLPNTDKQQRQTNLLDHTDATLSMIVYAEFRSNLKGIVPSFRQMIYWSKLARHLRKAPVNIDETATVAQLLLRYSFPGERFSAWMQQHYDKQMQVRETGKMEEVETIHEKITTNMNSARLGLFCRLMLDAGLITDKDKMFIARKFSAFFSTTGGGATAERIYNTMFSIDDRDLRTMKDHIIQMLNATKTLQTKIDNQ